MNEGQIGRVLTALRANLGLHGPMVVQNCLMRSAPNVAASARCRSGRMAKNRSIVGRVLEANPGLRLAGTIFRAGTLRNGHPSVRSSLETMIAAWPI